MRYQEEMSSSWGDLVVRNDPGTVEPTVFVDQMDADGRVTITLAVTASESVELARLILSAGSFALLDDWAFRLHEDVRSSESNP